VSNGLVQGIGKLVKVFFVEVYLGFDKTAIIEAASFAFGNGDVEILISRRLYIKEIGTLTGPNPLGKNIFLIVGEVAIVFVHFG
jgi:hypothetical protein